MCFLPLFNSNADFSISVSVCVFLSFLLFTLISNLSSRTRGSCGNKKPHEWRQVAIVLVCCVFNFFFFFLNKVWKENILLFSFNTNNLKYIWCTCAEEETRSASLLDTFSSSKSLLSDFCWLLRRFFIFFCSFVHEEKKMCMFVVGVFFLVICDLFWLTAILLF